MYQTGEWLNMAIRNTGRFILLLILVIVAAALALLAVVIIVAVIKAAVDALRKDKKEKKG